MHIESQGEEERLIAEAPVSPSMSTRMYVRSMTLKSARRFAKNEPSDSKGRRLEVQLERVEPVVLGTLTVELHPVRPKLRFAG